MAKVIDNILLGGLQGSIGKQIVIKIRNGKPYVAKHPRKRTGEIPTEKQTVAREHFARAQRFASFANKNVDLKAFYLPYVQSGQTVLNVAYRDAFYPPVIHEVDVRYYTGRPGQPIIVTATDNFLVVTVHVKIHNSEGSLIEEGPAKRSEDLDEWVYTTSMHNGSVVGTYVMAVAKDLAGNECKLDRTV